jgi:hypothetical protein
MIDIEASEVQASKKINYIRKRAIIYISIDDGNFPYREVKGKGFAIIVDDSSRTIPEAEKIYMKYLGALDNPIPMILDSAQKGNHVIIEIDPKFICGLPTVHKCR